MAQYIGLAPAPADLPGLRPTITTTNPATTAGIPSRTVTNQDMIRDSQWSPSSSTNTPKPKFWASCTAVAARAARWGATYRWELAPAATVGAITTLGWWQHGTPLAGWETAAYVAGALGSGVGAVHGLKHDHKQMFGGSAALGIAFTDVAAAVAAGPGAASATVSVISAGLAYAAYVPWLARHRKEHKESEEKAAAAGGQVNVAPEAATDVNDSVYEAPRPNPFHAAVIPYADDASDDVSDPIRIGWDENGEPVHLTMLYRHTLVAGASDFGKSGIVNLIIKKLLKKQHVELYGIDMKPGAPELGPWEPKMKRLARTPEEARDLLQAIRAECDRRGAFLADLSASSMASGRGPVRKWVPGVHGPAMWVIADELAELIRQDEELRKQEAEIRKVSEDPEPAEQEVAVTYESLLAIARSLGIQFISATQQPSAKVFGGNTDARGNYANRISTRVGEAGHTPFIFGRGCTGRGWKPEELQRPGEFYLGAPEMPMVDPPKCRAEYVTDEDIAADVGHYFQAGHRGPSVVQSAPQVRLLKAVPVTQPVSAGPELIFPDGSRVGRNDWPDLYRVFCRLCDEQGYATKDELIAAGPYESRDTARRALEAWQTHGVLDRQASRVTQYYLPDANNPDD